jgi:hypothetical protein
MLREAGLLGTGALLPGACPLASARRSRTPSLTLPHNMGEGWVGGDDPS